MTEHHRRDRELDRRREAKPQLVGHRLSRRDACPEVALADGLQVAPVLDVYRLVEPVLLLDLFQGLLRGALAEERLAGPPGSA